MTGGAGWGKVAGMDHQPHQPIEHPAPVHAPGPSRPIPRPPLIGPDDPPPATVENADGAAPVVLVCDHASRAIPRAMGNLGLEEEELCRHIAYDIGAAATARRLAALLDAPLVLSGYSRLIIDPNRALDDPTAIPVVSDDVVIPGNRALDAHDAEERVEAFFRPYQEAVAGAVAAKRAAGQVPALVSIHSFTPVMRGVERPWHVGVLWDSDPRIPVPLLKALRADGRWVVGDNEPYSGRGTPSGTIERHALPAGLPNALIELRQDLIATDEGAAAWADRLARALTPILADEGIHRVQVYPRA